MDIEGVDDVESAMTQPAKAQEPSMEEILASIRRIIADDEAKPPAEKTATAVKSEPPKSELPKSEAPKTELQKSAASNPEPAKSEAAPTKASAMKDIPPSAIPAARAAAAKVAPAPAASNSQDDIDAMLAGLDEMTSGAEIRPPVPDTAVFELTDDMALPEVANPSFEKPSFSRIEPDNDLEFTEDAPVNEVRRQPVFDTAPEIAAPPQPQILSHSTVSAVESAFNSLAHTVLSNNARTLEDLVKEMLRPMLKSWLDDNLPNMVERIVKAEIERVSRGR
jgi:cell pole-organizing protein PopZ